MKTISVSDGAGLMDGTGVLTRDEVDRGEYRQAA